MSTVSRRRFLAGVVAALPIVAATRGAWAAETETFLIATATYGGVYDPVGNTICRLFNRAVLAKSPHCNTRRSEGSVANIAALRSGLRAFALASADVVQNARIASEGFTGALPFDTLRVVFRAHTELFTVLADRASAIRHIDDLPGHRIAIGSIGTGQRATFVVLAKALGWEPETFSRILEGSPAEAIAALREGTVDAIVLTVGHPNGWAEEALFAGNCALVTINGPKIEALLDKHPYYEAAVIPGGLYKSAVQDTPSFGVRALLVTTMEEREEIVHALTRVVFDDFETFTQLVPALATLTVANAVPNGQQAPTHPGADRYFREQGLL